jgi:peptide/nickel transport system permease protein
VRKYFGKKIAIYVLTFFIAGTLNFLIPRLMPGDPISSIMNRFSLLGDSIQRMHDYFTKLFGFDKPVLEQYVNYWVEFFKGNLGMSVQMYPRSVMEVITHAIIYDIFLLLPAILVAFVIGNRLGAISAVNKKVDSALMPFCYVLTSTPYFWLALILSWVFGVVLRIFPLTGAFGLTTIPSFSLSFVLDYLYHWVLPFLSLTLVALGGWAIGMRNMVIYEMGANYSKYMEALGGSKKLIRRYAYRNGLLPQISGLAISIGTIVAGNISMQVAFTYPGLGLTIFNSIINHDYFLMQGCFLFLVITVLIANFIVDIAYMILDPRVRHSYAGEV